MRLLRKVLLKLTVLAVFLGVILYCFQTSNGSHWSIYNSVTRNVTRRTNFSTALAVHDYPNGSVSSNGTRHIATLREKEYYNVWCIFTKVTTNSPMKRKFKIFTESLLRSASVNIAFHVITDDGSQPIADGVIRGVMTRTGKSMKVTYYNARKMASQLEDIVSVMSPHFSSEPGTYYSDALFFLSLGLHRVAPTDQKIAAMFDADTKFRTDIKELFKEFDNFGPDALFGLAHELTPVYRHVLYLYRSKHSETIFGNPAYSGGFPGFNSGVVLFNLERLRESLEYDQIVSRDSVEQMTKKYDFKGHLGDQDFYTVLGMERPELIHKIDCGWNRQLCTWWRDHGYTDVFPMYLRCDSETKLWHGNCNTPIPDD